VLTLGGLVVSGTIIPDWQWFDDVEHAARAAFVVHVGGCIDDEHGGWARLFKGAAESLAKDHAERRAAREVTKGLPDRYQRLVAQQDQTTYIHLTEARVVAPGVSPLPAAGMHWRGRLSEISGWSFGHLGGEPPTDAVEPPPLRRKTPTTTCRQRRDSVNSRPFGRSSSLRTDSAGAA
jgi:hypothetical protein